MFVEVVVLEKITIRLFYAPSCSGGCCGCGPAPEVTLFAGLAEIMVGQFGEERLEFEAYNSLNPARFPVLAGAVNSSGKVEAPVVAIGEKIVAKGRMPSSQELEAELRGLLK